MGVAPSSPTLPVMSCDELATLAEDNKKSDVAEVIRTNQIDGAVAEDLDDEILEELCPTKLERLKLKKALKQLMEHFARLEAGADREHGASEDRALAAEANPHREWEIGSWKVLPRAYILSLSGNEPLSECRTLVDANVLRTVVATEDELLQGGGEFESIFIVSHRWEDQSHPDPDCTKLQELQKLLPTRPDITDVWWDFPCLPQGEKTEKEKLYFDNCLKNVNLLYLHGQVLVFLDKLYIGRFWPGYEFFLCTHRATRDGLVPKSMPEIARRVVIIEIGASKYSDGKDTEAIIATWISRTASVAVLILRQNDVFVTNKKDKEVLLPLLLKFEQRVKAMEPFDPPWCDARTLEDTAVALVAQGEAARAKEEFAEAIRLFSEAKAKDPNMAAAWYGYAAAIGGRVDGAAHKGAGANAEEEMAGYRRAIEIDPTYLHAHRRLALLLESNGDKVNAEASYRRALEIDPNYADAHYNLGILLEEKGDVKGAIASTEKFIAAGGHPGVNGEQRLERLKKKLET